jgi:phospholipid-binding lipoprotein MlaA
MKRPLSVLAALAVSLSLCGCATPSAQSLADNDPWEATNRDVFAFDVWIEHNVARPVNDAYRAVVPEPAREGVHNVTTNLHAPIVLANDVLQGKVDRAAETLGRIVINSTIGLGGLIDVAAKIGIPHHDNDFGVTLGKNGVAEGSYLVLPLIGPMPPRDLVGSGVDGLFDPLAYAHFHGKDTWMLGRSAFRMLDTIDRRRDEFETIERSSLDFYATVRNLYRQSRSNRIRDDSDLNAMALPDL